MSGRGRGRGGRGGNSGTGLTFSLEAMGLTRGDLPAATLQPPPTYPPLESMPSLGPTSEVDDYLLTLKQEFRTAMTNSGYFLSRPKSRPAIEKYSDKYETISKTNSEERVINWKAMPLELQPSKLRPKRVEKTATIDIQKRLAKFEDKDDENEEDGEKEEDKAGDEDNDTEIVGDEELEEEIEEGTDYTQLYFDNGENFLDDSDDNLDEGPIY